MSVTAERLKTARLVQRYVSRGGASPSLRAEIFSEQLPVVACEYDTPGTEVLATLASESNRGSAIVLIRKGEDTMLALRVTPEVPQWLKAVDENDIGPSTTMGQVYETVVALNRRVDWDLPDLVHPSWSGSSRALHYERFALSLA